MGPRFYFLTILLTSISAWTAFGADDESPKTIKSLILLKTDPVVSFAAIQNTGQDGDGKKLNLYSPICTADFTNNESEPLILDLISENIEKGELRAYARVEFFDDKRNELTDGSFGCSRGPIIERKLAPGQTTHLSLAHFSSIHIEKPGHYSIGAFFMLRNQRNESIYAVSSRIPVEIR